MKKTKLAMVLAEFVVAIFICGVLLTLSIHMFRANDMTKVPYIYSFLNQMPEANAYVIKECNYSGDCTDKGALPDSRANYCVLLTESIGTSGDVDCISGITEKHKNSDGSEIELHKNFTLINGISVYDLSYEGADDWQGTNPKYADALIGIKLRKSKEGSSDNVPRKGYGVIGENLFPVRIFKNGEIIPSYYDDYDTFNDDEFFAYKIVLNKTRDGKTLRENITLSFDPNEGSGSGEDKKERITKTTFKDAICRAYGSEEFKHYFKDLTDSDASCTSSVMNDCKGLGLSQNDSTAFCSVEYIKPQATGIFKFFGI